jgi:hypothetical protein
MIRDLLKSPENICEGQNNIRTYLSLIHPIQGWGFSYICFDFHPKE